MNIYEIIYGDKDDVIYSVLFNASNSIIALSHARDLNLDVVGIRRVSYAG